jgi:hypothetical protein
MKKSNVFVCLNNNFQIVTDIKYNISINDTSKYFGYHSSQTQIIHNFSEFENTKIIAVAFQILTNKIIYVITKGNVKSITKKEVDNFTKIIDWDFEYDAVNIEEIVIDAIKEKTFTTKFMNSIFGMNIESDGIFYCKNVGMYLIVEDLILSDVINASGYNKWAKHFRKLNNNLIDAYYEEALTYNKNDRNKAIEETNIQAIALSEIPKGINNEFTNLHITQHGNINYLMLLVTHYNKEINENDFKKINIGRYSKMNSEFSNEYILNKFIYSFENNHIINIVKHNN